MAPSRWPSGPPPSGNSYENLPITNSHCMNESCNAFVTGWHDSQRETNLLSQVDYGFWILSYYLSWIGLFTLAHFTCLLRDRLMQNRGVNKKCRTTWKRTLVARYRSVAYRRFTGRLGRLVLPSFGILALFSLSTLFCACLIFSELPYLRSRFRFGSPPLSVRCALCIAALMPLLLALGGKVNIVTILTGVCYTKLNIIHRYVGGLIFALSTVHMIPHIYAPVKDGGFNYLAQLYIDQKRELSGTILYFLFLWIVVLSVPWMRSRFYEFFAYMHIFLGFAFIGILWWHIEGEYMAPNYIYVTVGILCAQSILRIVHRNQSLFRGSLTGFPTTLERLPENVIKVTINVPSSLRWKPGHHSFMRMPSLSPLDNHPFAIASVPTTHRRTLEPNRLVFLIRTHSGFTKRLASRTDADAATFQKPIWTSPSPSLSTSSSTFPENRNPPIDPLPRLHTFIDGPYGGYTAPLHRTVDSVLLIAGGTGITAALPRALSLAAHMSERENTNRVRDVRLVWIVRSAGCISWVKRELVDAVSAVRAAGNGRQLVVGVYVTGGGEKEKGLGGAGGGGVGSAGSAGSHDSVMGVEGLPRLVRCPVGRQCEGWSGAGGGRTRRLSSGSLSSASCGGDGAAGARAGEQGVPTLDDNNSALNVHYERPDLAQLVPTIMCGTRAFVLGCGPAGLKVELANAVAGLQVEMVVKKKHMESIVLHTEAFGW